MAEKLGIIQASYSRLESGINPPNIQKTQHIAKILKIEVWELMKLPP